MARSSATSLAKQVAELRALVDQHVARQQRRICLRICFKHGTPDDEITELEAQVAAYAGVDPTRASWIHRTLVTPPPIVEEPRVQWGGPQRDNVLAEPRRRFERRPDAILVDERPTELYYPPSGIV